MEFKKVEVVKTYYNKGIYRCLAIYPPKRWAVLAELKKTVLMQDNRSKTMDWISLKSFVLQINPLDLITQSLYGQKSEASPAMPVTPAMPSVVSAKGAYL